MSSVDPALERIDVLIAEKEREVVKLREACDRLVQMEKDLVSLRHARQIILGESAVPSAQMRLLPGQVPDESEDGARRQSLRRTAVSLVRERTTPIHASELHAALLGMGYTSTLGTVVTALHRAVRTGEIAFLGSNRFGPPVAAVARKAL